MNKNNEEKNRPKEKKPNINPILYEEFTNDTHRES